MQLRFGIKVLIKHFKNSINRTIVRLEKEKFMSINSVDSFFDFGLIKPTILYEIF